MSDSIVTAIDGPVAFVTLNRPNVRNAFNLAMWRALAAAVETLAGQPAVRAIVLKGAGDKAFAAGADVSEFPEARSTLPQLVRYGQVIERALAAVRSAPQPVVAMIRGFCIGGGCELAAAADIRIGAEDARIGITPAKMGLVLGYDETRHLVSIVGPGLAKEMLFTGRLLDAAEAKAARFLNHVVPVDELEAFTRRFVDSFVRNAPITIEAAKRAVNACEPGPDGHVVANQLELHLRGWASGDFPEGVAAFQEKRAPVFKGDR